MRPDPTVLYNFGAGKMYRNSMSRGNMTRLDDVNWGDFCKNDDHIVPHHNQGFLDQPSYICDAVAKQHNEVRNDFSQALYSKGSATKNIIWKEDETYYLSIKNGNSSMLQGSQLHPSNVLSPVLSDFDKTDACSTLLSEDVSILDYYNTESYNTDANSIMFCLTTQTSVNESKTLTCLGSQQREGENELACSDWPRTEIFDDMLRNWDGTDNTDGLSWFSSNNIYGSENASKQGFQSSYYGLDTVHAKLEPHYSNANCLLKNLQAVTENVEEPTQYSYADCLYTNSSSISNSAVIEKSSCIEGNKPLLNSNDCSNGSGTNNEKSENMQTSAGNGAQISTAQMILNSNFPAHEMYFQQSLDQNSQLEFSHHTHQVPFTQITSSTDLDEGIKSSYGNVHCFDNFPEQLFSSQATKSKQSIGAFCQVQNIPHQRKVDDTEMNDAGLETSVRQKRSVATSISSDNSSKIISCFQQLQNVSKQLDTKTKLCIRDSLYRLAKSADQRKDFPTQNCSEAISESEGIQDARTSKRSEELVEAETSTNLIDRVVAYLLLNHSAIPYKSTKPADNTRAFYSEVMAIGPEQFDDMETDLHEIHLSI